MPTKAFERLDPKKRKNILDAAFREFEENTVDTASVNSIAIRAGVSRTTLYYYFHDINDIFSTVIDVLMNEFKQRMFMNDEKTQIDIFDSFHSFFTYAASFKGTDLEKFMGRVFKEMSTETRRLITDPFFKYYTKNIDCVKNLEKIKYSSPRELYDILFMLFSIVNSALQFYYTTDVSLEKIERRLERGFQVVKFGAIKEEYRSEEFKNE